MQATYSDQIFISVLAKLKRDREYFPKDESIIFTPVLEDQIKAINKLIKLNVAVVLNPLQNKQFQLFDNIELLINDTAIDILYMKWSKRKTQEIEVDGERFVEIMPKQSIPIDLKLFISNNRAVIRYNGVQVFMFKRINTDRWRYFKCLWINYKNRVSYKDLFEFEIGLLYPGKRKRFYVNKLISRTVRNFKKELSIQEVPLAIELSGGCTLTAQKSDN